MVFVLEEKKSDVETQLVAVQVHGIIRFDS
jgi:hypothetical protein